MPVNEASVEETPYGRYVTSDGWFVLNLGDALAVRNEEKGGAAYPLELGIIRSPTWASASSSSRPTSRMRFTTPKAPRKVSSCSRASARSSSRRRSGRFGSGTTFTVRPIPGT